MILTTLLACVFLTPIPLPEWRTRDAAPVISALGIQGDPSAACVHQLLDDFDADWGRLAAALDTELAWRDYGTRHRLNREDTGNQLLGAHHAMERSRRQHQVLKEICDRADVETLPKHILKALMHNSEDLRYREQEHDRALNLFLAACGSATDEQSYAIESFDDLARALRNTFEHDVRQLLRPSQQEIWQQLIMDTRRRRNLAKGQLRGEQIDLGVLILCLRPSLSPAEMAALQPMRSQWRTAIDARLAARAKAAHQCDGPPYSGVHALAPAEAMMTQERQLLEARRAVRDCTHHFMELVCEALPDAKARQLETAWLRAVCPALFGSDQKIMQAIERLQEADLDHATIQYWRDHLSAVASKARSEAAATILAADGFDHLYLIAIETGLPADTLAAELSLSRIAKEDCASRISSSIRDARKITPSDW